MSGKIPIYGDLDLNGNKVLNIADPTTAQEAATKNYVDALLANYQNLYVGGCRIATATTAGTFMIGQQNITTKANTNSSVPPIIINIRSADYASINGKTPKLRIRAALATNTVAPAANFTVGLYPITSGGGASGGATYTYGTVVTGSNGAVFTAPSGSTIVNAVGSDFNLPADGMYAMGVVSSATTATSSEVQITAQLQIHYT